MTDDHSGGDTRQQGQRQHRYRNMDTAAEDMRDGQQKIFRTTEISVFGTIDKYGCRRIAPHATNWEEKARHRIGSWSFWGGWR